MVGWTVSENSQKYTHCVKFLLSVFKQRTFSHLKIRKSSLAIHGKVIIDLIPFLSDRKFGIR